MAAGEGEREDSEGERTVHLVLPLIVVEIHTVHSV